MNSHGLALEGGGSPSNYSFALIQRLKQRIETFEEHLKSDVLDIARSTAPTPPPGVPGIESTMDEVLAWHSARVLQFHGGNKTQAAETLGVDRRTLYRWLDSFEAKGLLPRGSVRGGSR